MEDIINSLKKSNKEEFYVIVKQNDNLLRTLISNIPLEKIYWLGGLNLTYETSELLAQIYSETIKTKLEQENKNKLLENLNSSLTIKQVKKIILNIFNIQEDYEIVISLLSKFKTEIIINNYNQIKKFIQDSNINYKYFIQYGSGSRKYNSWLKNILFIIKYQKEKEFYKIQNYLCKPNQSKFKEIDNFLKILSIFERNYLYLEYLEKNKIELKTNDLEYIFKYEIDFDLKNISEYRKEKYKKFNLKSYEHLNIDEIKKIINTNIFMDANKILEYIGGVSNLKLLKIYNKESIGFTNKIDEIISYANLIEKVNFTNNHKKLLKLLSINYELYTKLQDIYINFEEKIRELYELDAVINLTDIEEDLTNKNYLLYAHVLSKTENIEDVVEGKTNGKNNFISMSPISYKGEKYYEGLEENSIIFGYNKIPKESFICSSLTNIGTNNLLSDNDYQVDNFFRKQRGILETTSATTINSEVLLYREGIKPSCIIVPKNTKISTDAIKCHEKYNLPFVYVQSIGESILNVEHKFKIKDINYSKQDTSFIDNIVRNFDLDFIKKTDLYTGKQIGLFTDSHAMLEPTLVVLEDMKKRNITEIYSLGDNIALGPNPCEVLDLLEEYKVKSVAGNSEYYNTLGIKNFTYFYEAEIQNQEWTYNKLGNLRINKLKFYPASIDLIIGNKKIALCHFINDVRWDYTNHSTWTYQNNFKVGENAKQFLFTNTKKLDPNQNENIKSSVEDPLFNGKSILSYDSIFEGHVHFEMKDKLDKTSIYTLRACGMGGYDIEKEFACYYILKEKTYGGFDLEKILVPYNKNNLISSVKSSTLPHKEKILSFLK